MSRILRFLFPTTRYTARASLFLLALRVLFGVLLLSHGIAKVDDFAALSEVFPDPLGLGSRISGPGNYALDRLIAERLRN